MFTLGGMDGLRVFRVTASECSLARVRRWRDEGTILRAYLSYDGALMLADPLLGGNASLRTSDHRHLAGQQADSLPGSVTT